MCTDGGPHDTVPTAHEMPDGSVRPGLVCVKCGAEWS